MVKKGIDFKFSVVSKLDRVLKQQNGEGRGKH